jgi:hypothetical protein
MNGAKAPLRGDRDICLDRRSNQMLEDSAFDLEGEIRGTVRAVQKSCRV